MLQGSLREVYSYEAQTLQVAYLIDHKPYQILDHMLLSQLHAIYELELLKAVRKWLQQKFLERGKGLIAQIVVLVCERLQLITIVQTLEQQGKPVILQLALV